MARRAVPTLPLRDDDRPGRPRDLCSPVGAAIVHHDDLRHDVSREPGHDLPDRPLLVQRRNDGDDIHLHKIPVGSATVKTISGHGMPSLGHGMPCLYRHAVSLPQSSPEFPLSCVGPPVRVVTIECPTGRIVADVLADAVLGGIVSNDMFVIPGLPRETFNT